MTAVNAERIGEALKNDPNVFHTAASRKMIFDRDRSKQKWTSHNEYRSFFKNCNRLQFFFQIMLPLFV